jgi:hypothetical protein
VVTVFRCDVRRSRDAVVVAPAGELDLSTVDVVERELDELRDAGFAARSRFSGCSSCAVSRTRCASSAPSS